MDKDKLVREIVDFIKNDAQILIPIESFFDENGQHITKKQYGIVMLNVLCDEIIEKFSPKNK